MIMLKTVLITSENWYENNKEITKNEIVKRLFNFTSTFHISEFLI